MIRVFKKLTSVFIRCLIFMLDGIDNRIFTNLYWKYLIKMGVQFTGRPNYISSKAYIDGQGYKIITIGSDVVISRNVTLLTHDYSIETALHAIGKGTRERSIHINDPITIGNNSFIGAGALILPGTTIGSNCIVGAGAVVKGVVPNNSIVIGNPSKILYSTHKYAQKCLDRMNHLTFD